MKIAYVCGDGGVPVFGRKGCSVHVREVIAGLRRLGHEVHLLAARLGGDPPGSLLGVPVTRLPALEGGAAGPAPGAAAAFNRGVRDALEAIGPVHCIYERHALWSSAAMAFARRAGIPGLLEVNAPLVDEQIRFRGLDDVAGARAAEAAALSDATAVLAVSEGVAAHVRSVTDRPGRVRVVPNGVDPRRFQGIVPPADHGPCVIGFLGTLRPWHGVELLVDAFAETVRRGRDARLLLVGDGPQRATLEEQIERLGLGARVTFTGSVDHDAVPGHLARMHVAVAPYPPLEPFYFSPLKLFEYMAAGRAVVASAIGEIPSFVRDGVTGLLCPPGDRPALAAALTRLCDEPALRIALGRAGRREALARHTWDAVARRIAGLAEAAATGEAAVGRAG